MFSGPQARFDVDRVLVLERASLDAEDEPELLDVLRQFRQRELYFPVFVEVVQLERLEVRDEQVAGEVGVLQPVEVGERLRLRLVQWSAHALLLDHEHATPEQVDEAPLPLR